MRLLGLAEVAGVHRHGLGPAKPHHHHHEQAKGVQMVNGIEGQPVTLLRGGVPQPVGRQAMADLMDHQAQQHRHDPQRHRAHAGPVHPWAN
ncbi:MAG: hypothetical protein ACLSCQ_01975 [Evtepia gabavorous]